MSATKTRAAKAQSIVSESSSPTQAHVRQLVAMSNVDAPPEELGICLFDAAKAGALLAFKPWLSREDVADLLHVSVSFVDRNLRPILPTYPLCPGSRAYVYKRSDLDDLLESNKFDPEAEIF